MLLYPERVRNRCYRGGWWVGGGVSLGLLQLRRDLLRLQVWSLSAGRLGAGLWGERVGGPPISVGRKLLIIDSKLPGNVRDGPQGTNRSVLFK